MFIKIKQWQFKATTIFNRMFFLEYNKYRPNGK